MSRSDGASRMRALIDENPFFLAPMAGWTDVVYRSICKEMGAGLTYTEMVSAQGLAHGSSKTAEYLEISEVEGHAVVQLFGAEPKVMAEQAPRVCDELGEKVAAIDINMGCPARKVVRKGEGSALMRTPKLAASIVSEMVETASVPITVKFRRGYEHGVETAPDFAKEMEQAGAAAICIHGRYATDLYHGKSDWGVVKRVKDSVEIPVIASGDLFSAEDVLDCIAQTGSDAVMIARGAQGNPWIFQQVHELVEHRLAGDTEWRPKPVGLAERLQMMRRHVRMLAEVDPHAVVKMRTFFSPYFKGMPQASRFRGEVMSCETLDDFEKFFDRIWQEASAHGLGDVSPHV
ncbi:MAG: tRNA dihydrouridine synthase DusB [Coriobacteriales bacterium]